MNDWPAHNAMLKRIVEQFGTPCFVYDWDRVEHRMEELRRGFGGRFQISYAVKSNPNRMIVSRMREQAQRLDISSGGELSLALEGGWPGERLSFTGPAKRDWELKQAVQAGIGEVVIESVAEARRLDAAAAQTGASQPVLIRISPAKIPAGFGVGMAGKPSQFGIDEEQADDAIESIRALQHLKLEGFHIYCGTQCLLASAITQSYAMFVDLFKRFSTAHDLTPRRLIFGSGLGIPYHPQDRALSLDQIADHVNPMLGELRRDSRFERTELILETGRYLIGEAGLYLARVIAAKQSRGTQIRLLDGGMNHHLGAAGHLGSIIHRNYRMFKIATSDAPSDNQPQACDLYGPLCTSIDMLGRGVEFAGGLEVGDIVAICSSGAYGLSASPVHFIGHPPPGEILIQPSRAAINAI